MRDGVRLAGNLYLPDGAGPFPGLLMYTPYLKDGPGGRGPVEVVQQSFARRGYACLTLDIRGFGASEGRADPPFSPIERQDGFDALEWMAAQSWCTGKTGMWGISYGGDTALSAGSAQPPSLRAIIPIHATDDEFTGVCYPHGCRGGLWSDLDWGFRMLGYQLLPPLRLSDSRSWARLWHDRLEGLEPWMFTWHTTAPSTWATWRVDVSSIKAAAYLVSAWHDCYPGEMLRLYGGISAPKRLLIGPWKHELPDRAVNAPIGFVHEMARWWDYWLKDKETGIVGEPPVILYDRPGGWRYAAQWPSPQSHQACYYLQPDGRLGLEISSDDGTDDGTDTYRVDPSVGLHHLPWDWTTPAAAAPADISPDDHRALTYTTARLDTDLVISGVPELTVHLSADQPDFPLAAWLSDVSPNGFSTLICQGWIRPVHQLGGLIQPGRVCDLRLSFFPTSYRVAAGHRLRLAIAGAHFPVLLSAPVNPNLMIHRSPRWSSRLLLPVVVASVAHDGMPTFQRPLREDPEAVLQRQTDHAVSRDLLGRSAAHQRRQREVYRLEGGTNLQTDMETTATIAVDSPREVRLQGTRTIAVEGAGRVIIVRTDVTETFEHCHLAAEITVDGRAFFHRAWDLDLRRAEWNLRGTAGMAGPTRESQA
jgi:uncharacterized protein